MLLEKLLSQPGLPTSLKHRLDLHRNHLRSVAWRWGKALVESLDAASRHESDSLRGLRSWHISLQGRGTRGSFSLRALPLPRMVHSRSTGGAFLLSACNWNSRSSALDAGGVKLSRSLRMPRPPSPMLSASVPRAAFRWFVCLHAWANGARCAAFTEEFGIVTPTILQVPV